MAEDVYVDAATRERRSPCRARLLRSLRARAGRRRGRSLGSRSQTGPALVHEVEEESVGAVLARRGAPDGGLLPASIRALGEGDGDRAFARDRVRGDSRRARKWKSGRVAFASPHGRIISRRSSSRQRRSARRSAGDSPAGADLSLEPEFEKIKGELDKLSSLEGGEVDWRARRRGRRRPPREPDERPSPGGVARRGRRRAIRVARLRAWPRPCAGRS